MSQRNRTFHGGAGALLDNLQSIVGFIWEITGQRDVTPSWHSTTTGYQYHEMYFVCYFVKFYFKYLLLGVDIHKTR